MSTNTSVATIDLQPVMAEVNVIVTAVNAFGSGAPSNTAVDEISKLCTYVCYTVYTYVVQTYPSTCMHTYIRMYVHMYSCTHAFTCIYVCSANCMARPQYN